MVSAHPVAAHRVPQKIRLIFLSPMVSPKVTLGKRICGFTGFFLSTGLEASENQLEADQECGFIVLIDAVL